MIPKSTFNIILIGMPGSGKTTMGEDLAKRLSYDFVDTDDLIQELEGNSLQDIIDTRGCDAFLKIEEDVICKLIRHNHVIATGGSAVYSQRAMNSFKQNGIVVFLDVDLPELKERITDDYDNRGIVKRPNQSLEELYNERYALYKKYADITIDCSRMTDKEILDKIMASLAKEEENGF
jgi:shikimate kinase